MKFKNWYYLALLISVASILIFYIWTNFNLSALLKLSIENISILLLLYLISILLFVLNIKIFLKGMGHEASFKIIYLIVTSSLALNYTTPVKIGIPLRAYLYKKILNMHLAHAMASLCVEIFVEIFLPILIAIIGIISVFHITIEIPSLLLVLPFLIIFLYILISFKSNNHFRIISQFSLRNRYIGIISTKVSRFVINFRKGLRLIDKKTLLLFSFILLIIYSIDALWLYTLLNIFGIDDLSPICLLYINSISFTIGMISMIPMGLGTRDATSILLLMKLGVPNEIAISVALIQRAFGTGLNAILGLLSTSVLGIKFLNSKIK